MKTETIRMTVVHVNEESGPFGVCWSLSLRQADWEGTTIAPSPALVTDPKLHVWTDPALHVGDVVEIQITPVAKDGRP